MKQLNRNSKLKTGNGTENIETENEAVNEMKQEIQKCRKKTEIQKNSKLTRNKTAKQKMK